MSIVLHPKYQNFYKHTGRYSCIIGGRGSGKSFSISSILVHLTYTTGQKILFSRLTMTSAYKSIIPEIVDKIELMGKSADFRVTKDEIVNLKTNSSIIFMGLRANNGDNTARLKSIAGITTLVVEEAEELTDQELFNKVNLSIRSKDVQNRVILILNPASKSHWIYKRFYEKKGVSEGYSGIKDDCCYIHSTYLDNKENLSEDFISEVEQMRIDYPEKYKHIVLGGWLEKAEGVIFTNWEYGDFPNEDDTHFGADWGFVNDPATLIEVYVDKANMLIYAKEHVYEKGLLTNDIANKFKRIAKDKIIFGDTDNRLIEELKLKGINIKKCRKGADSIVTDIALIQDYKIIVDRSSINLVIELNNYVWNSRTEKPIDSFNHLLDAFRYVVKEIINPNIHSGIYHFH